VTQDDLVTLEETITKVELERNATSVPLELVALYDDAIGSLNAMYAADGNSPKHAAHAEQQLKRVCELESARKEDGGGRRAFTAVQAMIASEAAWCDQLDRRENKEAKDAISALLSLAHKLDRVDDDYDLDDTDIERSISEARRLLDLYEKRVLPTKTPLVDEHPPRGGHPLQPIALDEHGVARFKPNKIVRALLDWSTTRGIGMNELILLGFPTEDWEQLAQLLGYSVSGAGDLSYFSDEAYQEAEERRLAIVTSRDAEKAG